MPVDKHQLHLPLAVAQPRPRTLAGPTAILRNAPYHSGSLEWIRSRCLTGRILSA